jgi:hypothetical protein
MKSLNEFKSINEEEKSDYSKFDTLVRAGLANKAQIQRIHKILDKMGEERPVFNNADRMIVQNLFNKMVDLISNNKQIFNQTRRAVREDSEVNELPEGSYIEAENIDEAYGQMVDPPAVLILKRTAIRVYPNDTRVALYYSQRLKKIFTVPYSTTKDNNFGPIVQAEETEIAESHMADLQKIKDTHQHGSIKHTDGTSSKVDVQTAHAILTVHKALNDENKKKFSDLVGRSKQHLQKAADFSFKHLK